MAPETPRGVSSRLLTMKFMQRAVASENSSPDSETHSSKKRKTAHSPAAGRLDVNIDQAAIKAAMDAQETKRQAALEQHIGADTRWVLDSPFAGLKATSQNKTPLNVVYVGYGDIDSSYDSGDNEDVPTTGRTSTNSFKKAENQAC
ncbi:transcription factor [Fusarium austroafricanum]|uniref:Transcription factor n=1 Tax=Fusarium austroafricanum TaxID=2364996 RepID=A0A8H4KMC4_9HYPO|nr:transcription factor [Fusarium austroafricanum]